MKLVFLALSMRKGGAERVIANLSNFFIHEKFDVSIITCVKAPCEYMIDSSIFYCSLDSNEVQEQENKIKRLIRRRRELIHKLRELKPDVIVGFLPEPSFILLSIKYRIHAKYIITERGDPQQEYTKISYRIMMKLLYPFNDGFVFQTKRAKDYFNKRITRNSVIIPNPISEEFLQHKKVINTEKEIVTFGRLDQQKNHALLICAFANIREKYPEYVLKIYGDGQLRGRLQELIKEKKLSGSVFLMGKVDNVKQALEKASLFVLSSNSEGMPNALMEAMAVGVPCISTDCPCGGPEYLIDNGVNGLLSEVGDVNQLSKCIDRVLGDYELAKRLGKNAEKIVEKVAPNHIYDLWKEYILSFYM